MGGGVGGGGPARGLVEVSESAVARSRQWAERQREVTVVREAAARKRAREATVLWGKWLKAKARHEAADRALAVDMGMQPIADVPYDVKEKEKVRYCTNIHSIYYIHRLFGMSMHPSLVRNEHASIVCSE